MEAVKMELFREAVKIKGELEEITAAIYELEQKRFELAKEHGRISNKFFRLTGESVTDTWNRLMERT